ncbi:MAG: hypothetical protein Q4A54_01880 [Parabacteroides sp.]|nr:hypothetical protein [Parabacteroides sp.]
MNKSNIKNILDQYADRFDELNGVHEEWYKWTAIDHFKGNWDIDADDFAGMFNEAVANIKSTNLIDSTTLPLRGILEILKIEENVEPVREAFRELFSDDSGNLDARLDRIYKFIDTINKITLEHFKDTWKYLQNRNSVIWYLNLWDPENNFIYKAEQAKNMAACIEYSEDIGQGINFSLEKYYGMCKALLREITNHKELMDKHFSSKDRKVTNFVDDLHILAFDVIYCAGTYNFYTGMDIFRGNAEQRKKHATIREIKEALEEKEELLSYLEKNRPVYPDFNGCNVNHKKYGECIVRESVEGKLEFQLDVAGETKHFSDIMKLIGASVLTILDSDINEQYLSLKRWEDRKYVAKMERTNLQIALAKLK